MRKIGSFFKGILACICVYLLQIGVVVAMAVLAAVNAGMGLAGILREAVGVFTGSGSVSYDGQLTNVVYGVLALLIFGIWYHRALVRPYKKRRKQNHSRGFSFHTIMAILFLGIGMQYVTTLVSDITAALRPDWLARYNALIENAGYTNPTLLIIVYSIILAPIVEETVFRGLIYRYTRLAFPFWVANIWQALLFGMMHGNWIQGIYAFVLGLILGFVCHRGRGIRYSVPIHIVFNIMGLFFSGFISLTTDLSYPIAVCAGVALTIFALWLFSTDFAPSSSAKR